MNLDVQTVITKEPLWTRNFVLAGLINAQMVVVFYLLIVVIGVYAVKELQSSTQAAGLISGIFVVGALLGRLFIGRVMNKLGTKNTLNLGLILYAIASLGYFFSGSENYLVALRFFHGIGLGVANTAVGTIIAQIIPSSRKGEGIGHYSMSTTIATAIGPFIGLSLLQHTNFTTIFLFCFALCIISLVTALFLKLPPESIHSSSNAHKAEKLPLFSLRSYLEPTALGIGVVIFIYALCYSSILSFIRFYAEEVNLTAAALYFFVVYSIAILLSRPFTGKWMDTYGENFLMYPCFFIFMAGLWLLSMATTMTMFLGAAFLIGLGFGNLQSISQAIAIKLSTRERMGFATATYFIFLDAGIGLGPFLLGGFVTSIGLSQLYLSLVGVVFISFILYYVVHGRKARLTSTD